MNNSDLEKRLDSLAGILGVLAKTTSDQQGLVVRMMCHQQAHLAAIRHLLVKQGVDRNMLNQQLRSAYDTALDSYQDQLSAFAESGDIAKFLGSFNFPDDVQGN